MRFADRIARSPRQVVRYAYGGLPLWSASDPPKEDVPPCACGEPALCMVYLLLLFIAPSVWGGVSWLKGGGGGGSFSFRSGCSCFALKAMTLRY